MKIVEVKLSNSCGNVSWNKDTNFSATCLLYASAVSSALAFPGWSVDLADQDFSCCFTWAASVFCILPPSQFLLRNEMGKVLPHPSNGTIGQCGNKSHLGKVKSLSFNWLPVDYLVKGTLHLKPTHAPPNWPIWAQTGSVIYSLALTCRLGSNIQRGQNM